MASDDAKQQSEIRYSPFVASALPRSVARGAIATAPTGTDNVGAAASYAIIPLRVAGRGGVTTPVTEASTVQRRPAESPRLKGWLAKHRPRKKAPGRTSDLDTDASAAASGKATPLAEYFPRASKNERLVETERMGMPPSPLTDTTVATRSATPPVTAVTASSAEASADPSKDDAFRDAGLLTQVVGRSQVIAAVASGGQRQTHAGFPLDHSPRNLHPPSLAAVPLGYQASIADSTGKHDSDGRMSESSHGVAAVALAPAKSEFRKLLEFDTRADPVLTPQAARMTEGADNAPTECCLVARAAPHAADVAADAVPVDFAMCNFVSMALAAAHGSVFVGTLCNDWSAHCAGTGMQLPLGGAKRRMLKCLAGIPTVRLDRDEHGNDRAALFDIGARRVTTIPTGFTNPLVALEQFALGNLAAGPLSLPDFLAKWHHWSSTRRTEKGVPLGNPRTLLQELPVVTVERSFGGHARLVWLTNQLVAGIHALECWTWADSTDNHVILNTFTLNVLSDGPTPVTDLQALWKLLVGHHRIRSKPYDERFADWVAATPGVCVGWSGEPSQRIASLSRSAGTAGGSSIALAASYSVSSSPAQNALRDALKAASDAEIAARSTSRVASTARSHIRAPTTPLPKAEPDPSWPPASPIGYYTSGKMNSHPDNSTNREAFSVPVDHILLEFVHQHLSDQAGHESLQQLRRKWILHCQVCNIPRTHGDFSFEDRISALPGVCVASTDEGDVSVSLSASVSVPAYASLAMVTADGHSPSPMCPQAAGSDSSLSVFDAFIVKSLADSPYCCQPLSELGKQWSKYCCTHGIAHGCRLVGFEDRVRAVPCVQMVRERGHGGQVVAMLQPSASSFTPSVASTVALPHVEEDDLMDRVVPALNERSTEHRDAASSGNAHQSRGLSIPSHRHIPLSATGSDTSGGVRAAATDSSEMDPSWHQYVAGVLADGSVAVPVAALINGWISRCRFIGLAADSAQLYNSLPRVLSAMPMAETFSDGTGRLFVRLVSALAKAGGMTHTVEAAPNTSMAHLSHDAPADSETERALHWSRVSKTRRSRPLGEAAVTAASSESRCVGATAPSAVERAAIEVSANGPSSTRETEAGLHSQAAVKSVCGGGLPLADGASEAQGAPLQQPGSRSTCVNAHLLRFLHSALDPNPQYLAELRKSWKFYHASHSLRGDLNTAVHKKRIAAFPGLCVERDSRGREYARIRPLAKRTTTPLPDTGVGVGVGAAVAGAGVDSTKEPGDGRVEDDPILRVYVLTEIRWGPISLQELCDKWPKYCFRIGCTVVHDEDLAERISVLPGVVLTGSHMDMSTLVRAAAVCKTKHGSKAKEETGTRTLRKP